MVMKIEKPAVFLDRDGVLNEDLGYVFEPKKFHWIDGAIETIKYINNMNFFVFVISNQSGLARGYFYKNDIEMLHNWINEELLKNDAKIDKFYYCPHHPQGIIKEYSFTCRCRKPEPGMILNAFKEWPIVKSKSFMIGDKASDIKAANSAGIAGHLFKGGNLLNFFKNILI
tara:strand:- start:111 stop:623 length:513 start_codon:yes stop_codon:yes gene_type:complete